MSVINVGICLSSDQKGFEKSNYILIVALVVENTVKGHTL